MQLSDLLAGVSIVRIAADMQTDIEKITYDSRKAVAGALFVCIRGFQTDGHQYIESAVKNGASVILTEEAIDITVPHIVVKDTRLALARLAANFYGNPSEKIRLIGITGTNGKTTVSYLIKSVLEQAGHKVGLIGTNQNMIGSDVLPAERTTPESLELQELFAKMVNLGITHVVMEVSSHSIALHRVAYCNFSTCVFTNLTQDHLDFHKTMENYKAAKAKLFDMCKLSGINIDDAAGADIAKHAQSHVITYAENNQADIYAQQIRLTQTGISFLCQTPKGSMDISLCIPGNFSVYNALCAISACYLEEIPLDIIAFGIHQAKGVVGRAEVVYNGDFMVMVDYAHSPDGLTNIIPTMKKIAKGRVVTLFGCGGNRDKTKRPIMAKTACSLSDFCIITSDNPRREKPMDIISDILDGVKEESNYLVIENRRDAIQYAIDHAQKNDIILLCGKGHETYQEINGEKHHFDEREIVSEILKAKGLKDGTS